MSPEHFTKRYPRVFAAIDGQWTPSCRDRVLADAGFADRGGRFGAAPAAAAPQDAIRMDVMAMWTGAVCRAVNRVI